eukprot:CAMPEP_0195294924 /NCGR_PEP_ID=MMETSP0707-20130614/16212_1 /TAXON_ID=33640 /ORGANISM="Asterionellopsis glacialis, Strain CCMP134" /LENGTH=104 /DNA_ID=CAMNT_0040356017 /DNA_START=18 /DNA_END=329 /DNA_ORIENTATION=+
MIKDLKRSMSNASNELARTSTSSETSKVSFSSVEDEIVIIPNIYEWEDENGENEYFYTEKEIERMRIEADLEQRKEIQREKSAKRATTRKEQQEARRKLTEARR